MQNERQVENDARDSYAWVGPESNKDMGIKITLHRGGGGSFGTKGVNIIDTYSTEMFGARRTMTESDQALLNNAVRALVHVLDGIRE